VGTSFSTSPAASVSGCFSLTFGAVTSTASGSGIFTSGSSSIATWSALAGAAFLSVCFTSFLSLAGDFTCPLGSFF